MRRLNAADISLDDHIVVVGGTKAISFAESGIDLGYRNSGFRVKEWDNPKLNQEMYKPQDTFYNYGDELADDEEMEW